MISEQELIQYISDLEALPRIDVELTQSAKEFILNTLGSFDLNDTSDFEEFLEGLIASNIIEMEFTRKYADIVYDPNVSFHRQAMIYVAEEVLKFIKGK